MNSIQQYRNLSDWDLIVQVVHYSGALHERASWVILWGAFCLADGFGQMTGAQLRELEIGFDWSHVRDSTEAGHKRVAEYLRKNLAEIVRSPVVRRSS